MIKRSPSSVRRSPPPLRRGPRRCRLCREKVEQIDYKDVVLLQKFTSIHAKIAPRKRSGNCARHQRMVKRAVRLARYMALIPYLD